jgi:CysZ protein
MAHMIKGMASLFGGFAKLLGEPTLRHVLWRMLLLLAVLMLAVCIGVYDLAEYLAGIWLPTGDAWYWQVLSWLVWLLVVVIALLTGAVSFTVLGSVAVAPWLDMLAARTELLHTGRSLSEPAGWWRPLLHSLGNAVRPLFELLLLGLLALAVIWIPVLGQVAAMLIWGYAGIRFLNYELLDVPATRRGWNFARRKAAVAERLLFWLGFGGLAMALLLLPLVNLFVLPAATVALSTALPTDGGEKT